MKFSRIDWSTPVSSGPSKKNSDSGGGWWIQNECFYSIMLKKTLIFLLLVTFYNIRFAWIPSQVFLHKIMSKKICLTSIKSSPIFLQNNLQILLSSICDIAITFFRYSRMIRIRGIDSELWMDFAQSAKRRECQ